MSSEKAIIDRLEAIIKRQNERLKRAEEDADLYDDKPLEGDDLLEDAYLKHKRSVNLKYTALVSLPILGIIAIFIVYLLKTNGGHLDRMSLIYIIGALCLFFVYVVFIFLIQRMALTGVNKVSEAILKVLSGKRDVAIEDTGETVFSDAYKNVEALCDNYQSACDDLDKAIDIAKEASEAKRNFFSNMSHEMRTPLSAMLGLCEMIQRESTDSKIRDYAKDIAGAGKTLLLFINDAFDISKLSAGKLEISPENYDLTLLINDIINMSLKRANDKGIGFNVTVDENMPHLLHGDDLRIKQCLLNIISNGIKYTSEGKVELKISFLKSTEGSIIATFTVADTGRGMTERDLDKILDPVSFYEEDSAKSSQGVGLGMSVTKKVLNLMGSELRAESVYGVGSTFKFSVEQKVVAWEPIGNFEETFKHLREAEEPLERAFIIPEAKILVVDDSSVNLMIAEGLLKDTKAIITLCESGEKAIEECKKQRFDLILLDHMMPQLDGIETLKIIKESAESRNRDVTVIALTANAIEGAKDFYLGNGFDDYLSKPIETDRLENALKTYIPNNLIIDDPERIKEYLSTGESSEPKEEKKETFMESLAKVGYINPKEGLEHSGSLELYQKVVGEFTDTGLSRADTIEQYFEQMDFKNYTIQVHALKSAARIIGALPLSHLALALEKAGNEENETKIKNATGELLRIYRELVNNLEPIVNPGEDKETIDNDSLKDALAAIREMVEAFDFDGVDSVMEELKKYAMPDDFKDKYAKLKTLVAEVARDDILALLA